MPPKSEQKTLETPIQYVKGIGPKRAAMLIELGINTVRDLLYYYPRTYLDLSRIETIANLRRLMDSGQYVSVIGEVRTFDLVGRPPTQRFILVIDDGTATLQTVFFRNAHYYKDKFVVGETLALSGRVTGFQNKPQMVHPNIDHLSRESEEGENGKEKMQNTRGIIPQYSSTGDLKTVRLDTKGFRRILDGVVKEYLNLIDEYLPMEMLERNELLPLRSALKSIHFPESPAMLERARDRLKFDELFAFQLFLAHRRRAIKAEDPGIAFNVESPRARTLVDALPFKLTRAQGKVIREIADDMKSPRPMSRLLQGDVGSGKTIVALISCLIAIDNGYQTAFMAPTEILAEQHFRTLSDFLSDLGVNVRLLISGQSKRLREDILEDIRRGSAQIVVGTHALIQEGVEFARLGFIVIDEQHRFGVVQRIALKEKGRSGEGRLVAPDVLVMTATPIPRTLALTLYGDLDVSVIDEMPAHRRTIKTGVRVDSQRQGVYQFVRSEVQQGRQAYIVYPLVEESEKLDLKAATESFEELQTSIFPDLRLGLIHGRMQPYEKDEIMRAFKERELDILVATTVIEVGIDIPNASIMVIEHAERFGLSQLHQLRGRVGRGAEQSYCILLAPDWAGKLLKRRAALPLLPGNGEEEQSKAVRRLATMVETVDGFKIAEVDLELRGPGDFFGTRQSGMPILQLANLLTDHSILLRAREEAFRLLESDPHLRLPQHEPLRLMFSAKLQNTLAFIHVG